jgi:hypothetical protein
MRSGALRVKVKRSGVDAAQFKSTFSVGRRRKV